MGKEQNLVPVDSFNAMTGLQRDLHKQLGTAIYSSVLVTAHVR